MNEPIAKEDVIIEETHTPHECNALCSPPRHSDVLATGNGVTLEITKDICIEWCYWHRCELVSVEPAPEAPLIMTPRGMAEKMWLMTWVDKRYEQPPRNSN